MDQLKLLIVYPNQFGYHTDSYKYCEHLQNNFEITYVCFDQGFERLSLPKISTIYVPFYSSKLKRRIKLYTTLSKITRKEKFTIIFIIQFKYCFILRLFARSAIKILDFRTGDLSSNPNRRNLNNFLYRFDAFFFQNITVISEGVRDILHLDKIKTHILPLGADVISDEIHLFDRLDLLYVGTLSLRNIEQTIFGLSLFLSEREELRKFISYTILGFGSKQDEADIVSAIETASLQDTVRFLGRKKYSDLRSYFETCNIGVAYVPVTPYFEFQPVTKLFEYMLSGMPVIATNTYENRLIVSKNNGVLISDTPEEFCNGLSYIYKQRNSFDSSIIRESVKSNTWNNIVDTNLAPYLDKLLK